MFRFIQIALLSVGLCFLNVADVYAQKVKGGKGGKGGGGSFKGGSSFKGGGGFGRGSSSIRSGHGGSSIGHGHHSTPHIGGTISGRSRLQHSGHGHIGSSRRIPNSAGSIRSLQQPLRYGSSLYGSSGYGATYSRNRLGGSSLGIYIGGVSPYWNYGSFPYGYSSSNYGYSGYNYVNPSIGYYNQYPLQQFGSNVPIIYNDATISQSGVLPAPVPVQAVNDSTPTAGTLPRNTLPTRSVVTHGAPDIGQPGMAVLYNPAESGGAVHYALNGNPFTIRPGEAQPINLDRAWTLEFDRGLNNESARYSLNEGIHKFKVGRNGWEVVQATPNTTVDTRKQPSLPAPPVPVETVPKQTPQTENDSSAVPVPIPDDRPLPTPTNEVPATATEPPPPAVDPPKLP